MTLTERIKSREPKPKVIELRRQPAWIRRMQQQGLPPQDMTAYVRRPDGDAA